MNTLEKILEEIESEGTIQNRIVTDILNGIADWCCSEAPIDGEEESETFKVLKQVYEFVETFLDEGTPTETSTGKELE